MDNKPPRHPKPLNYNITMASRTGEHRDCMWYYGDGGCLDLAARLDLKAVPCQLCVSDGGILWPLQVIRKFHKLISTTGSSIQIMKLNSY